MLWGCFAPDHLSLLFIYLKILTCVFLVFRKRLVSRPEVIVLLEDRISPPEEKTHLPAPAVGKTHLLSPVVCQPSSWNNKLPTHWNLTLSSRRSSNKLT